MSSTFAKVLVVLGALIAAYILLGMVLKLAGAILALIMPVLVVGGIVYVLYAVYGRKALSGGKRTLP